jgi:2-alkenal reductase
VLRVETRAERLIPLPFADSDSVVVGQRAIAIGNPFGLASSMTIGIISALGRQLPSAELISNTVGGFNNPSILQVDADINPGNSGGPLLNTAGQVIGVNTAIRTVSGVFEGVGFAVPANTVRRVVPDLIERGEVAYAWVGISSLSAENGYGVAGLAEVLGLPVEAGVLIDSVTPGSPAASAGLLGGTRPVVVRGREVCAGGDIIVAVDGRYVRTMDELVAYLVVNSEPGESIELLIVRGEDTFEVPVRLEARPSDDALQAPPPCGE